MPDGRPNILILMTDQLRRQALSCYGDPNLDTPNVDRLAKEGTRFRKACATYPICVPFRFTMMTGQPAHTRAVPTINWRMSPAERTLADQFSGAGYETIYIGKWHLWGQTLGHDPVPPEHRGRWEQWFGYEHPEVHGQRPAHQRTFWWHGEGPEPTVVDKYETDGLYDLAMDYLARRRDPSRPFACIVSVRPPHPPMNPPPELAAAWEDRPIELPANVEFESAGPLSRWAPPFDEETILREWRMYYGMVQNIDANVGRMMEFLERNGLAEETAVVFLSDHGELGGAHGLRRKSYPYEESIGIPLIIRHPGAAGGRVIDEPTCTEDLFPTFLGLAGLQPPAKLPGADLTPLVRGEADRLGRQGVMLELVGELRPRMPFYRQQWRGFRTRRFKYTALGSGHELEPWQFFDLTEDPLEMSNLLSEWRYEERARRHHALLGEALKETGDSCKLSPFRTDSRPEVNRGGSA